MSPAMSVTVLGIILLSSIFWPQGKSSPIVGGRLVELDIFKYSYMVSLQEEKQFKGDIFFQHFCGGSLISQSWVLTVAHCVHEKNPKNIVAVVGEGALLNEDVQRYPVLKSELNSYHPYNLRNDIALVKIDRSPDVLKKEFKTINLSKQLTNPSHKKCCQVLGYGANKYGGEILNRLYVANVSLISNKECVDLLGKIMAPQYGDNKICALGKGTDSCQGDSGGPLICSVNGEQFIYGIVSQGLNCGLKGVPSIYTIVNKYLNWIINTIAEN